jgi:glucosylceramidase
VKSYLGPALQKASLDTKIWILDHTYKLWGRVVDELSDPDVYKYVDGVAWHGIFRTAIGDDPYARHVPREKCLLDRRRRGYQGARLRHRLGKMVRHLYGNPAQLGQMHCELEPDSRRKRKAEYRPFLLWRRHVNSQTREVTRNGQFWAFAHYSKIIQCGAQVFASSGDLKDVDHVAVRTAAWC